MGWLSSVPGAARASGVVIAPPLGYAHLTSHPALRALAERLAATGHVVLRYDPDGTGDSGGDPWDPDRVEAWRRSLHAAVGELRALGCERVTLAGVRLNATFALLDGAELGADAVVAWRPVASGRRYAKEIRMLSTAVPEEHSRGCGSVVAAAGEPWTAATLDAIGALPATGDAAPAPRVLLVDGRPDKLAGALRELGAEVDTLSDEGSDGVLEVSAEKAVVPEALLDGIATWIGPAAEGLAPLDPPAHDAAPAALDAGGAAVHERVVRLGADGLVGVLCEPLAPAPDAATLLLLNSGSEPHFGPGRAWVQFARALAAAGHRSVRMDFRGWGESPGDASTPREPYAVHCQDDVRTAVGALRDAGHVCVVPFGLCSAAWVALKVALTDPLDGVIALNPQMYWEPGGPITLTPEENHVHRTGDRAFQERWARLGAWSALDVLGVRAPAGRWLDALAGGSVPVTLLFAVGDEGHHHLLVRHPRRLRAARRSGMVEFVEVPDIDHSMHQLWRREAILAAVEQALAGYGRRRAT